MYRKWNWVGLPCILTSGLMQYQNEFCCYFFFFKWLANLFSSLRSELLNVTQCSWIFFVSFSRSPLRPSLIKKQSMVYCWHNRWMCIRFVPKRNNLSSLSRNPTSTSNFSMVYTYETSSDFLTLNSHTWPWILWIFYCLSMTCFLFFSSETLQVVRKICLFWTRKDSELYFTRTLSFLSSSIISSCF